MKKKTFTHIISHISLFLHTDWDVQLKIFAPKKILLMILISDLTQIWKYFKIWAIENYIYKSYC